MAMKSCKECGTEISSSAKVCPKCGKEQRNFFQKHIVLTIILVLMIFGIITSQTNKTPGEHTIITSNNTAESNATEDKTTNQPSEKKINIGDIIQGKDWEITINEANFAQRVEPPEKDMFYNYYQVDDTSNTYLYITLDCKNISNLELSADSVAKVTIKYNNNYTYSSFSAIPDKTLGFSYTSLTKIKPLTTDKIYYLAEMPNSIASETDTPVEIHIEFENQKYVCQYR